MLRHKENKNIFIAFLASDGKSEQVKDADDAGATATQSILN